MNRTAMRPLSFSRNQNNTRTLFGVGLLLGMTVGAWAGARARDFARSYTTPRLIDWERVRQLAIQANARERLNGEERARLTAAYRELVERAAPLVASYTGDSIPAAVERVYAFDRVDWIDANLEGFAALLRPIEELVSLPDHPALRLGALAWIQAGQVLATTEVGIMLGFLARRVLGQYDLVLLGREPITTGRLYFVEPNVRWVERQLGVHPVDFRFWLALHEVTHAFEFEAHPWLRDYLNDRIVRLVTSLYAEGQLMQRLQQGLRAVPLLFGRGDDTQAFIESLLSTEQRELFQQVQAVMAVIEGYGNHVMNAVGRETIPSYAEIARRFEQRQQQRTPAEQLFIRLIGLDVKLEQYRLGEQFADAIIQRYGRDVFRRIWEGPALLPTLDELRHPDDWARRVTGRVGEPTA